MNIVQITHFNDYIGKRYTFRLPECIELKKGAVVRVRTRNGKEQLAQCVTNSHNIEDEELLEMVTGGNKVCSDVVGVYSLATFAEIKEADTALKLKPILEGMVKIND